MKKQITSVQKVEKALEEAGCKGWMLFGFVPPHDLIYTRSVEEEEKVARAILKTLMENPSLKEMFRHMVQEIDRGLTTEPTPGGRA